MIIYYDKRVFSVNFGVQQLKKSLKDFYVEKDLTAFDLNTEVKAIVVRFSHGHWEFPSQVEANENLKAEGFEIIKDSNVIYINGYDSTGAMYGLLDIAETIKNNGYDAIEEKLINPFHAKRGIKHNMPYEPYDEGDPFSKNTETMMDKTYWKAYIDMLAINRYNTLSLWSENPFTMMFRLDKYPNTTQYSDEELAKFIDCYHFIFTYSRKLGISTYLVTWNVRLTPQIAEGLGLPIELGDMEDRYDVIRDNRIGKFNPSADLDCSRCHLDIIQDYFKECIKTVCLKYKNLTGLGTTASEEMSGDAAFRVQWVKDAYLEGIKESGRDVPFIFRTNCTSSSPIIDNFMKDYKYGKKYLSWKYSNAHMYSSTAPEFEKEWNAWEGHDIEDIDIMYTVRNDDFHTLRGGSYPFIKEYIKNMKRNDKVVGFYWGADGYVWGKEFQHVPHKHMNWKYDFEKHWYQFMLLGRLGYNCDESDEIFIKKYEEHCSKALAPYFYNGFNSSMDIIRSLQRTNWINYDFESHPESLLTVKGFRTVLDFMDTKAMAGIGTLSLVESALAELNKETSIKETTNDCLNLMRKATDEVLDNIREIENKLLPEHNGSEVECSLLDLKCWYNLGLYYVKKVDAAYNLVKYRETKDNKYKEVAVELLKEALPYFEELAALWSSHYMPYKMVRSKYMFGYTYYIDEVKKDIKLAKNIKY